MQTRVAGVVLLAATILVVTLQVVLGTPPPPPPPYVNPVQSAEQDEIKSLPGLSDGSIKFRQYSGYLKSTDDGDFSPPPAFYHYWLVEHTSGAPATAPLMIWLNGGQGTSSLYGLFAENGPFEIAQDGRTLKLREFAWNKMANVLYLEAPTEVGFSYALGVPSYHSDERTVAELALALQSFFDKFPQYRRSQLYLAGQSQGGARALELAAHQIYNKDAKNVRGVIIGNGFLHAELLAKASLFFAWDNKLLNATTWTDVSKFCCGGSVPSRASCVMEGEQAKPACKSLRKRIYSDLKASGVNVHNIHEHCEHHQTGALTSLFSRGRQADRGSSSSSSSSSSACDAGRLITNYMNQNDVRVALNIPNDVGRWDWHKELVYINEISYESDGLKRLLEMVIANKIPTILYNGNLDMVCSALGSEWFVDELKLKVEAERKPWKVDGRIVGFVKKYEGLTLVTVNEAGHSAPADKPKEIYELIQSFVSSK